MKTCKIKNPKMIEQDIIKHVIKYNLLANTRHSSMAQNITTRPFMHGQTILHVTLFCNIDN
jgi:hypothetical protein